MTFIAIHIINQKSLKFLWLLLFLCSWGIQEVSAQNSCNFEPGETVTLNISGQNTNANYVQRYILVNAGGTIAYSQNSSTFTNVAEGKYFAYAVNYDQTQATPNLTVGTDLANIGGDCVDLSEPLTVGVCDCSNNTGNVTFNPAGFNNDANFTQVYALTDESYNIISTQSGTSYSNLTNGIYNIIAVNYDNTQTAPNLSAGTSIFAIGGDCVDLTEPLGFVVCLCDITDAENLTYLCNPNNTAGDTEDDFFTISLIANNNNPGVSNQYQVLNGNEVLETATYGQTITLEWSNAAQTTRFLADGTTTYNLTVRDVNEGSCTESIATLAQSNCSDCPPNVCLPVIITKRFEVGQ